MLLNGINYDGAERKIFRNCVDGIRGRGKLYTLKKVVKRTVYGTDELEE